MTVPYYQHHEDIGRRASYGFFGNRGGHSSGTYESLNCGFGSQDERQLVAQNRALCAQAFNLCATELASVYQIHSADVVTIHNRDDLNKKRPKADGLVTKQSDIGLSILTADCTPVLLMDEDAEVIGACHAGWRGAALGIVQNTIAAMQDLGATAQNIKLIIGPTIAKASYQVGCDMRDEVMSFAKHAAPFFTPDDSAADKFLFDLPGFVAETARASGLDKIYDLARDTYGESENFFSHRRATHQALSDTGRQLSLITLKPNFER